MASIFTKIIQGEIPAHKIAENDKFLAFLDIMPLTTGHTLVIPKQEIDYIYDLDDQLLAELHLFAKQVAKGIKQAYPCERISVIVAGFEVPHAHVHLIPSNDMQDLDFNKRQKPDPASLAEVAENIRKALG